VIVPIEPQLRWSGWPFLGSQDFALRAERLPPGGFMLTFASFGASAPPVTVSPGCEVFLALGSLVALPVLASVNSLGKANLLVAWPANPAFVGVNYGFQALGVDPASSATLHLTNAVDVVLGF
jgi:hypothetical protein